MTMTQGNRTVVSGTRLAPRKKARPVYTRSTFLDPDVRENQGWRLDAVCLEVGDPELWFSDEWTGKQSAAEVCWSCPVRELCLAWATTTRQQYGIWGGIDFGSSLKPWRIKR